MTNPLLTTPRALKTAKPAHVPNTTAGITYTPRKMLGSANTGEINPSDTRNIATASHDDYAVIAVGDTTYALTPNAAIKLANQIGTAANTANGNQWADYADELANLMQDLYKK